MDSDERERLRLRYRPAHVKVLFVGESPPRSGAFFYRGDSDLYEATKAVFEVVCRQSWAGDDPDPFLRCLRGAGCYLDDLSHEPISHLRLKDTSKREMRLERRRGSVSGPRRAYQAGRPAGDRRRGKGHRVGRPERPGPRRISLRAGALQRDLSRPVAPASASLCSRGGRGARRASGPGGPALLRRIS